KSTERFTELQKRVAMCSGLALVDSAGPWVEMESSDGALSWIGVCMDVLDLKAVCDSDEHTTCSACLQALCGGHLPENKLKVSLDPSCSGSGMHNMDDDDRQQLTRR